MKLFVTIVFIFLIYPICFSQKNFEINGVKESVVGDSIGTETFGNFRNDFFILLKNDTIFYNEVTTFIPQPSMKGNMGYVFPVADLDTLSPQIIDSKTIFYIDIQAKTGSAFPAYFRGSDAENGNAMEKHVSLKFRTKEMAMSIYKIFPAKSR